VKKVKKEVADKYFKTRVTMIAIFLFIGFLVSFGIVFFAEQINESGVYIMGMPAHYYMGAQGAVVTFIVLLFLNAVINDRVDKKFGIDESRNEQISKTGTDH
jgi:putative solute:sodium symporter small subunit